MTEQSRRTVLEHLRHLLASRIASDLDDDCLLERFLTHRDQQAFEAILQRHGPLVLSVCRRQLSDAQDIEDAFQATFLILAQRAGSIRNRELLPSWLYGVAQRTSQRVRQQRQRRHERQQPLLVEPGLTPAYDTGELRVILDEEIQRLPDKYRVPVILCYMQERTSDEAARLIGCPRATLATRLSRAREKLRDRLARRGLDLSLIALGGVPVSPDWQTRTARLATLLAIGEPADLNPTTQSLMQGVIRDMNGTSRKLIAAALLTALLTAATIVLAAAPKDPPTPPPATAPEDQGVRKAEDPKPAEQWTEGKPFKAATGPVTYLALSPDGKSVVAVGTPDIPMTGDINLMGAVEVWDSATGKKKQTLSQQRGFFGNITALTFSPDGKYVVVGETSVKVWDVASGKMVSFVNETISVSGVAFSPDGKKIAAMRFDGYLRLYPFTNGKFGKPLTTVQGHQLPAPVVAFSGDGKKVVTMGYDGTVKTWDASTAKLLTTAKVESKNLLTMALSPDGQLVAVSEFGGGFAIFDASSGKEQARWKKQGDAVTASTPLSFAPDGKQILVGYDKKATLWDVATQKKVHSFDGPGGLLSAVHISADGRSLASSDQKGQIKVVTLSAESSGKKP